MTDVCLYTVTNSLHVADRLQIFLLGSSYVTVQIDSCTLAICYVTIVSLVIPLKQFS